MHRAMIDEDDEVRDRATLYYHVLKEKNAKLNSMYILNELPVSLSALERQLQSYLGSGCDEAFNMKTVPVTSVQTEEAPKAAKAAKTISQQELYAEELSRIPEFESLGPLFKSSDPQKLTEAETEYQVSVVKHCFQNHILLQFNCDNTLNDQVLHNLTIEVEGAEGYDPLSYMACEKLSYGTPGKSYTILSYPDEICASTLSCTMKFEVHDCDPNTGDEDDQGFPDEYVIDDIEITIGDFIQKVVRSNFSAAWEEIGDDHEVENTYHLSTMETLEDAVAQIINFLGMMPSERSDKIPEGKVHHILLLAGVYKDGNQLLASAKLVLKDGVQMQLTVRGTDPESVNIVAEAIG